MNISVIVFLLTAWATCCVVGYGVVHLVLPRHWRRERLLLMPIFGASAILFLSSLLNYAGAGMRTAAPATFGIGVTASGCVYLSKRRDRRPLTGWRAAVYTNLLGLSAGLSALASVVLYNAWNPYTDAFTYVSIADYLLGASYFTPADPGAHYPILTQMLLYQRLGLRMGSNFLLAFFTGLFGEKYAFDVYMPVLALGLWLGVPSFWVLCRRVLFMRIEATAVATGLYGLHAAVPIASALLGFMPQTWGVAFMLPAIALHVRATGRAERARRLSAAGTMGAMTLLSYTEIVLFALASIGTCYLVRLLFGRLRFVDSLISGVGPILIAIALAPVAAWNFVKALTVQLSAVVGWDMKFHFLDYISMLAGFRTVGLDAVARPGLLPGVLRVTAVLTLITVLYACLLGPLRTRRQVTYFSLIFLLVLGWFSLGAVNPWNPAELGHPWNTYKVVTYGFFLFAAMWGVGLVMMWKKRGLFRLAAVGQVVAFLTFFPIATAKAAKQTLAVTCGFTGVQKSPTAEYKRLRQVLADLPPNTPVNLIIPSEAHKHRQIVAYFLRRPVIADWSDDGYIWPWLDPAYRALKADPRYPSLVYTPSDPHRTVANLTLDRDQRLVLGVFGAGWYEVERDTKNWWRWLEKEGEIDLFLPRGGRVGVQAEIAVVGPPHRTITISVVGHPDLSVSHTLQERWFSPFSSDSLTLPSGNHRIVLSADGPVARMGQDPRNVRIGVRNLSWTLLPELAAPFLDGYGRSK